MANTGLGSPIKNIYKYGNPGGDCYWVEGRSNLYMSLIFDAFFASANKLNDLMYAVRMMSYQHLEKGISILCCFVVWMA